MVVAAQQQQQNIEQLSKSPSSFSVSREMTPSDLFGRVAFLGLAFSLLFTGYNVSQAYVTSIYHSTGFAALCLIYASFAISCLVSPTITASLERRFSQSQSHSAFVSGEKLAMSLAGIGYLVFILCLASHSTILVLCGAVFKGLASGLLWISQGVWLTKQISAFTSQQKPVIGTFGTLQQPSPNIVGISTGIFFTLFNLNAIIGNLLVIFLLKSGFSITTMILSMAFISALGTLMITFSSDVRSSSSAAAAAIASKDQVDINMDDISMSNTQSMVSVNTVRSRLASSMVVLRIRQVFALAARKRTLLLTPYLICQGLNMSYTYGNYPTFMKLVTIRSVGLQGSTDSDAVDEMVALNIAYGFLAYGVGCVISSMLWGKVYDFFNSRLLPLLSSHLVLVSVGFTVLLSVALDQSNSSVAALIFVGFLFGLIDFLTNAIINNSIAKKYSSHDVPLAFSWYRFCFCIGFAFASALSSFVPDVSDQSVNGTSYGWLSVAIINIFMMTMSVCAGWFLDNKQYAPFLPQRPSFAIVGH